MLWDGMQQILNVEIMVTIIQNILIKREPLESNQTEISENRGLIGSIVPVH